MVTFFLIINSNVVLIDRQRSDQFREAIGKRNPHSFQIVAFPDRMLLFAFFSDSGGPDRVLDLSLVVFDDGAVFRSSLVVSKSHRLEEDTCAAFFSDSGGPNKRNAMKNERKFLPF